MTAPSPPPPDDPLEAHPDVHAGRDGWLFLTGGSNRVLEQFGPDGFPRARLWEWRRRLVERVRLCAALGIRYAHAVAPEKLTVLPELTAGLPYDPRRAPVRRLARWLHLSPARGAWIDLLGALRAARSGPDLYLRTDTHWTFAGCEVAYEAILRHLGVPPRRDIARRRIPESVPHFAGDLGSKFSRPRAETALGTRFVSQARRVHANAFLLGFEASGAVRDAHLGALAVFRNEDPAADPRRLVLFGDSYCQHSAMSPVATLTPFLADSFREVHFLWSPSIDWDYVRAVRPDFVIGEIAERFMIEVPPRNAPIERLAAMAAARKAEEGAGRALPV
ncbi:hypothetical protein MMB17_21435 [Methylobacterium organophilum]|uniref:alginate O-acetyltransferase AlgX-related protein n=1 Tax=Methylobacterium organophilum TaxID=410 RepID=UPI001F135E79|nr:hypothetical protein [Methylobacterium organophilum]UMY17176.1 hypothetical protein MMB17_21435 [Methylobacterium organophilum]